jgi:mevalonate pyrophosphate decarboxylase
MTSLFSDGIIVNGENSKEFTKIILEVVDKFREMVNMGSTYKSQLNLYILVLNICIKITNKITFTTMKK